MTDQSIQVGDLVRVKSLSGWSAQQSIYAGALHGGRVGKVVLERHNDYEQRLVIEFLHKGPNEIGLCLALDSEVERLDNL